MATFDISNSTFTLVGSLSPVTLTCKVNSIGLVQASSPQIIEGYGLGKAQVTPGGFATFEIATGGIWKLTAGSLVSTPSILPITKGGTGLGTIGTTGQTLAVNAAGTGLEYVTPSNIIASIADTDTVDLDVTSRQLTANVRYQDSASAVISEDAGGLKVEVDPTGVDINDLTGVLEIAKGGTNSSTALNNNRIIISSGGKLVEQSAITANRALIVDANGLPIASATTATELGYVNGVTSAIQTQLNAKEPTITVLPIAKGGTGNTLGNIFTIHFGSSGTAFNPADATNYFIGQMFPNQNPGTDENLRKWSFPYACTLIGANISIRPVVAGSAGNSTFYLRNVTTATDSTISSTIDFSGSTNITNFNITGLNVACPADEEQVVKWLTPTWNPTNPTTVTVTGILYFRMN